MKIPALFTSTCRGRSPQEATKERTESRSATSSCLTSSEGEKAAAEARVFFGEGEEAAAEEGETEARLSLLAAAAAASSISSRLRAAPLDRERQARTTAREERKEEEEKREGSRGGQSFSSFCCLFFFAILVSSSLPQFPSRAKTHSPWAPLLERAAAISRPMPLREFSSSLRERKRG